MTREEFIKRFVEILKSKANLNEGTVAEISLLLELMPNTYQPTVYYYPYNQSYWKSSPYEDNKIYCTSDEIIKHKPFVEQSGITGGRKLKEQELINSLMEGLLS